MKIKPMWSDHLKGDPTWRHKLAWEQKIVHLHASFHYSINSHSKCFYTLILSPLLKANKHVLFVCWVHISLLFQKWVIFHLYMTSLLQSTGHKMAALTVMFFYWQSPWCFFTSVALCWIWQLHFYFSPDPVSWDSGCLLIVLFHTIQNPL